MPMQVPKTSTPEWCAQGRWLRRLNELEQAIVAESVGKSTATASAVLKWRLACDIAKLEVGGEGSEP